MPATIEDGNPEAPSPFVEKFKVQPLLTLGDPLGYNSRAACLQRKPIITEAKD